MIVSGIFSWPNTAGGNVDGRAIALAAAAGYLLGSLPFGYLVARAKGVNIFEVGSRSSGATNVRRTLGARAGYLVFALDALKGALAAGWPLWFLWHAWSGSEADFAQAELNTKLLGTIGLVCALVGHSYSCFTHFKGGKGVAAAAGAFLVLMPPVTILAAAIWVLIFVSSGYVSLASIVAAVAMPLAALVAGEQLFVILIALAVAIFVVVRHRPNILRLRNGTEAKARGRRGGSP
jgi:glycerol-3-phosphate acyltransferase PlsY